MDYRKINNFIEDCKLHGAHVSNVPHWILVYFPLLWILLRRKTLITYVSDINFQVPLKLQNTCNISHKVKLKSLKYLRQNHNVEHLWMITIYAIH